MSLEAGCNAFRQLTTGRIDLVTAGTVRAAGERAIELSPVGDPALWMKAPPPNYRPGFFRSNWFYSPDTHAARTHDRYDVVEVNGLGDLGSGAGGHRHFIANATEYGPALEYGHSSQAPAGIVGVIQIELPAIAEAEARKVGA